MGSASGGAWADGVGAGGKTLPNEDDQVPLTKPGKYTGGVTEKVQKISKIRKIEGPRGYSTRAAVILRYVGYAFVILVASGLTQAATNGVSNAQGGGWFMLLSITSVIVVGAISTLFYLNMRVTIVSRVRHYVFGLIALPGTLLAIFLKAAESWLGSDTLGSTLGLALPIIFLATIILPAFVFAKEMMSIRTLNQSKLDDEEAVLLWTRQDGLSR